MRFLQASRSLCRQTLNGGGKVNEICGRTPLMVQEKYAHVIEDWNRINKEEQLACDLVRKDMIRDFGNLSCFDTGKQIHHKWFQEVIEYHAKGFQNWSIPPMYFVRAIKGDSISQEELRNARILSNLINMATLNIFMTDDYIDKGESRNGLPCWHSKRGDVTIFDSLRLDMAEIMLAHHYFKDKPYYDQIFTSIAKCEMEMCLGQEMDIQSDQSDRKRTADDSGIDWNKFTLQHYQPINYYKSSCFIQRVVLTPFYFCGIQDKEILAKAKQIAILAGELIQITNDWFDWALWDHKNIHSNGDLAADAKKGVLTWSIATAWAHANNEQKKVLRANFGVDTNEAADQVIRVYKQIGVPQLHLKYDIDTCEKLFNLFDAWDATHTGVPSDMFCVILTPLSLYYTEDKQAFRSKK